MATTIDVAAPADKQHPAVTKESDRSNARLTHLLEGLPLIGTLIFAGIVYGVNSEYPDENTSDEVARVYGMYQDVHVMIYVGFGFLMTFPKNYMHSSLLHTLLIGVIATCCVPMVNDFWHDWLENDWSKYQFDISSTLIGADFGAGSMLIAYGAHLGRLNTVQIWWLTTFGIIFYGLNEVIGVYKLKTVDMGGSMFVHTFGAFYGLCSSISYGWNKPIPKEPAASRISDVFAMLGSLFLWMYWPSFNGALATGGQQHRVVINTVLALASSAGTVIAFSPIITGERFDMVLLQNAILAGGVAVGSASDLVIGGWGAILLGFVGGMVSVLGYTWFTPWLRTLGVNDTCGVINLHGLPGIVGALGGAFSAMTAGTSAYGADITTVWSARDTRSANTQGGYQLAALATTLGISCAAGILGGIILRFFEREDWQQASDANEWQHEDESDDKDSGLENDQM